MVRLAYVRPQFFVFANLAIAVISYPVIKSLWKFLCISNLRAKIKVVHIGHSLVQTTPKNGVGLAVTLDKNFNFYYPQNLIIIQSL